MSQRQLPPVRISFIADTTQFNKASDDVLKKVQKVADSATKIQSVSAGAASIKMATQTAVGLIQRQLAYAAQQLVSTVHTVATPTAPIKAEMRTARDTLQTALASIIRRMVLNADRVRVSTRETNRVLREATDLVLHYLLMNIRRMVVNVQNVRATGSASVNRTLRDAVDVVLHSLLRYIRLLVVNAHNVRVSTRQVNRAIRDAIDVAAHAIISSIQASFTAAAAALQNRPLYVPMIRAGLRRIIRDTLQSMLQTISMSMQAGTANLAAAITPAINQFIGGLGRAMSRLISTARRNATNALTSANIGGTTGGGGSGRATGGGGGRGGGGGGGSNFDMGARADIFMNMRALQTMQRYSASIFDTYMKYQDLTVAIGAFAGGATSAARVMKEIQDYAIASPYDTIALAEGARNMMAYGQSAAKTMEVMKMVGDVAGGSANRYNLLMYAMSQVTSLGKLQGNELRQLTEQGFNPLVYWAERTKGANESMEDAMRRMYKAKADGLITSDHVIEALKAETSEGGRFFKLAEQLNNSLRGLSNQVRETGVKISIMFLSYIEPSAKRFLKYILEMQKKVVAFMEDPANNMLVAQIADITQKAFLAVGAFFALGFAFASFRWMAYAVTKTLVTMRTIGFIPLRVAMVMFRAVAMLTTASMVALRYSFYASVIAANLLRGTLLGAAVAAQGLSATMFFMATVTRIVRTVITGLINRIWLWHLAMYTTRIAIVMTNAAIMVQRGMMITLLSFAYAATIAYGAWTAAIMAVRGATLSTASALAAARAGMVSLNAVVAAARLRWLTAALAMMMTTATMMAQMIAVAVLGRLWVLATLAMHGFRAAGWLAHGAMVALRLAAAMAWLAALGPVALVIAAIGAVALAIWGVISLVSSPGGLTGAFTRAWESVKWFATAAWGFMSNFGENMQILTQYVSDNWYAMLTALGGAFMGVLSALPGNFLVALRTGMRMLSAFGGWLGSFLPGAFKTAYNKIYEFLSGFFTNLISISKRVWEYISDPSQWGTTGIEQSITAFMDTLRDDANSAATNGLGVAMTDILTEEMANLRTGLEDFSTGLPPIDLNLKPAPIELPPGIEEDPTKLYKQFGDMFNPFAGEDKGGVGDKGTSLSNAMSATSGEYRKFLAEFSARQQGAPTGEDPQVSEQRKTNSKMDKLIEAVKSGAGALLPARVGGVP